MRAIQPRILSGTWRQSDQFPIPNSQFSSESEAEAEMRLRAVRKPRASDENWELSIDQIPHVPLVLHGCVACGSTRFHIRGVVVLQFDADAWIVEDGLASENDGLFRYTQRGNDFLFRYTRLNFDSSRGLPLLFRCP